MALITPIELKGRIDAAIRNLPRFVEEELEKTDFAKLNAQNLMEGKDGYGEDMPRYRDPEYAHFKTAINPRNRGFWDLRVTGEYHKYFSVTIKPAVVFFKNTLNNEKSIWLKERLGTRHLGIPEKQFEQIQIDNAPAIREKILKIINGN